MQRCSLCDTGTAELTINLLVSFLLSVQCYSWTEYKFTCVCVGVSVYVYTLCMSSLCHCVCVCVYTMYV